MTFGVGSVHKLLTNTTYIGRWRFNQTSSRTRHKKPDEEIVEVPVPAIIAPHVFDQVQCQLRARSPKVVAPRVTTGPILLTGLAICATCGGMMLRTGTSKGARKAVSADGKPLHGAAKNSFMAKCMRGA